MTTLLYDFEGGGQTILTPENKKENIQSNHLTGWPNAFNILNSFVLDGVEWNC